MCRGLAASIFAAQGTLGIRVGQAFAREGTFQGVGAAPWRVVKRGCPRVLGRQGLREFREGKMGTAKAARRLRSRPARGRSPPPARDDAGSAAEAGRAGAPAAGRGPGRGGRPGRAPPVGLCAPPPRAGGAGRRRGGGGRSEPSPGALGDRVPAAAAAGRQRRRVSGGPVPAGTGAARGGGRLAGGRPESPGLGSEAEGGSGGRKEGGKCPGGRGLVGTRGAGGGEARDASPGGGRRAGLDGRPGRGQWAPRARAGAGAGLGARCLLAGARPSPAGWGGPVCPALARGGAGFGGERASGGPGRHAPLPYFLPSGGRRAAAQPWRARGAGDWRGLGGRGEGTPGRPSRGDPGSQGSRAGVAGSIGGQDSDRSLA